MICKRFPALPGAHVTPDGHDWASPLAAPDGPSRGTRWAAAAALNYNFYYLPAMLFAISAATGTWNFSPWKAFTISRIQSTNATRLIRL